MTKYLLLADIVSPTAHRAASGGQTFQPTPVYKILVKCANLLLTALGAVGAGKCGLSDASHIREVTQDLVDRLQITGKVSSEDVNQTLSVVFDRGEIGADIVEVVQHLPHNCVGSYSWFQHSVAAEIAEVRRAVGVIASTCPLRSSPRFMLSHAMACTTPYAYASCARCGEV